MCKIYSLRWKSDPNNVLTLVTSFEMAQAFINRLLDNTARLLAFREVTGKYASHWEIDVKPAMSDRCISMFCLIEEKPGHTLYLWDEYFSNRKLL